MQILTTNKLLKTITLSASLFCLPYAASAKNVTAAETPSGFKRLAMYMGNGVFDPSVSEPRPGVTGCTGLFCDGEFFQEDIMHRTPAETEAIKEDAKAYFLEHFGLDVDDPALAGRISFSMFMVNPDFQYRLHILSGEKVGPDGWIIRDGGFKIDVIDPDGVMLGGKNAGIHADAGSAMFFGNYNILVTDKNGKPKDELIIFYKSTNPGMSLSNGAFVFNCTMFNEDWGEGVGMGTIFFKTLEDGTIRGNGRNVLTFPPENVISEFPDEPAFDAMP